MAQPDVGEIVVGVIDSAFRFYVFFGVFCSFGIPMDEVYTLAITYW